MDVVAGSSVVSPADLRTTMGRFATGVAVVTVGGAQAHAMTANSLSSVSLDPPLVLCCVARTAVMHGAITDAGHFAASVLRASQETHARYFADRTRPLGEAQFRFGNWHSGDRTGAPVLEDCLAWLECDLVESFLAGDHSVFIGQVVGSWIGEESDGLLFFDGKYRQLKLSRETR